MHLQAGTEPVLLGRPTEPGETTQGLEGSLQPTGFAVYVFFSVLSVTYPLGGPHSSPLCPSDLDVPPDSVSAETEGAHRHIITTSENPNSV